VRLITKADGKAISQWMVSNSYLHALSAKGWFSKGEGRRRDKETTLPTNQTWAWGIRSHAVTSVRQRVDTQGAVPDEVLKLFLSCTISPRAGSQSISKVALIPLFMTPGLVQHETGIIYKYWNKHWRWEWWLKYNHTGSEI